MVGARRTRKVLGFAFDLGELDRMCVVAALACSKDAFLFAGCKTLSCSDHVQESSLTSGQQIWGWTDALLFTYENNLTIINTFHILFDGEDSRCHDAMPLLL
jgi:hypothetical protein